MIYSLIGILFRSLLFDFAWFAWPRVDPDEAEAERVVSGYRWKCPHYAEPDGLDTSLEYW